MNCRRGVYYSALLIIASRYITFLLYKAGGPKTDHFRPPDDISPLNGLRKFVQ